MKQRGVNRVTMAVWDLEKGKELYSKLLGADFHSVNDADAAQWGVRCAIAWNAGVELVSPIEGRDSHVRTFLEQRGEGITGVVFAVEDVDASRDAAVGADIPVLADLDYSQEQIDQHLQGRFTKYKEYFFGSAAPIGGGVVVGEFVDADE